MYDTSVESIDILQRFVISNRELAESKYWRGGVPASQAHLHSTHILSCRHIVLLERPPKMTATTSPHLSSPS